MRLRYGGYRWLIDGTDFAVGRGWDRPGVRSTVWTVQPLTVQARLWVERHDLHTAQFATRRQALLTVQAYMAADPVRSSAERSVLRRQPDGTYKSEDGRWTVTRRENAKPGGGYMWRIEGPSLSGYNQAYTLDQASVTCAVLSRQAALRD